MEVLSKPVGRQASWFATDTLLGWLANRVGAEHSTLGRWKVLCMVFFRHHQYAWWALWQLGGPIHHMLRFFTNWLDTVIYPELRTMKVDRPVFVLGHPRSGTTFLQRRLFETGQASMFRSWEIWFPTLTERMIGKSVMGLLRQLGLEVLADHESGHQILLEGIEEDESIFLHRLDSDMLTYICPYLITDPDVANFWRRLGAFNRVELRRTARYYEDALKRQLLYTGKPRAIAKSNPNIHRILQLLERFPDAKFIYLIRSPEKAIGSYLSLHDLYVSKMMTQEERAIYMHNKYRWCLELYREFERVKHRIPKDQLLILRFEELTENVTRTMKRVIEFTELEPDDGFWEKQRKRDRASHRKAHENAPLEYFGLCRDEVRRDLKSIYEEYGLE